MTLPEMFEAHKGLPTHKYPIHMEAYERFFNKYRETNVRVLEIGIDQGGSLQLWREYFGPKASIIGLDIQDKTSLNVDAHILVGDQGNPGYWDEIIPRLGEFDIIIDDGSHVCNDQITSLCQLFPLLKDGGFYACEDIHTSYHATYGGGHLKSGTFIELLKCLIDELHKSNYSDNERALEDLFSLHIYPSLAILEKRSSGSWGGSTIRPVEKQP